MQPNCDAQNMLAHQDRTCAAKLALALEIVTTLMLLLHTQVYFLHAITNDFCCFLACPSDDALLGFELSAVTLWPMQRVSNVVINTQLYMQLVPRAC